MVESRRVIVRKQGIGHLLPLPEIL